MIKINLNEAQLKNVAARLEKINNLKANVAGEQTLLDTFVMGVAFSNNITADRFEYRINNGVIEITIPEPTPNPAEIEG